jgi:hypothetical protein
MFHLQHVQMNSCKECIKLPRTLNGAACLKRTNKNFLVWCSVSLGVTTVDAEDGLLHVKHEVSDMEWHSFHMNLMRARTMRCDFGTTKGGWCGSTFVNCSVKRSPGTAPSTKVGKLLPFDSSMHTPWRWCARPTQSADTMSPLASWPLESCSCVLWPYAGETRKCRRFHCRQDSLKVSRVHITERVGACKQCKQKV